MSVVAGKAENNADVTRKVARFQRVFAWPTILMSVVCPIGIGLFSTLMMQGALPAWLAFILNTYLLISCFTPLHESVHGNMILPNGQLAWLNKLFGFITGGLLFLPFHLFTFVHISHHRFSNNDKDPDFWLHSGSYVEAMSKCAAAIPHYLLCYWHAYTASPKVFKDNAVGMLGTLAVFALPVIIAMQGYIGPLLILWVGPAVLAVGVLNFLHWTLHRPYTRRGRFRDANILRADGGLGRFLNVIYQMQNYHLIHHLFPRIPFYLQIKAFDELQATIKTRGGRVVDVSKFI